MSSFNALEKRKPPGDVVVTPRVFDDTWDGRPKSAVCLGLRFVSDDDLQAGRQQAAKVANRLHPRATSDSPEALLWADAYHDALLRWIVARGTCDPNDVSRPWDGWRAAPEDIAAIALTSEGAQYIFDAWERMRIATDPTIPAATDEELAVLPARAAAKLSSLERAAAVRIRRLVRFCLDELGG